MHDTRKDGSSRDGDEDASLGEQEKTNSNNMWVVDKEKESRAFSSGSDRRVTALTHQGRCKKYTNVMATFEQKKTQTPSHAKQQSERKRNWVSGIRAFAKIRGCKTMWCVPLVFVTYVRSCREATKFNLKQMWRAHPRRLKTGSSKQMT